MYVKINGQRVQVIPDSGAALSIITTRLANKLNLQIDNNERQTVNALNNSVQIIGAIEDPPIQIGQAQVPISLRVIDSDKETLLLGMDWYKKYHVNLMIADKLVEFTAQGQRYQTPVSFEQKGDIFVSEIAVCEMEKKNVEGVGTFERAD
jgi:predicted aspartyl protease